jgi:hypothetical protein
VEDAMKLMARGAENRHVGETRLNRESSRSHSVFTCTVERHTRSENGLTNILFSRLNLIDLAGEGMWGVGGWVWVGGWVGGCGCGWVWVWVWVWSPWHAPCCPHNTW